MGNGTRGFPAAAVTGFFRRLGCFAAAMGAGGGFAFELVPAIVDGGNPGFASTSRALGTEGAFVKKENGVMTIGLFG